MSTVKATNLQHPSASSANIIFDSSGNATMAMATPFDIRNKVINNVTSFASLNPANIDYQNIMKLVEEGQLVIQPAE